MENKPSFLGRLWNIFKEPIELFLCILAVAFIPGLIWAVSGATYEIMSKIYIILVNLGVWTPLIFIAIGTYIYIWRRKHRPN